MNVRKLFMGLSILLGVCVATAFAVSTNFNKATDGQTTESFQVIDWEALVPQEWDPLKGYRDSKLDLMNDNDPKVLQLMRDMRAAWDNAPTVAAMSGASVKIAGYLVPIEETKKGMKEFLLVPYFGACIHSPPPPANQIIHVVASKEVKGFRSMDTVWVSGTMSTHRQDSSMGKSGYKMDAMLVERYSSQTR